MKTNLLQKNIPKDWKKGLLDDYVESGVLELTRGNVISKIDIKNEPGNNPIYSSSIHKNGLFGTYSNYMFDEELITWSVDGGGNFFYRPKHKFSVTNVGGILRILNKDRFIYKYLYYLLEWEHGFFKFDYQAKAHPSVIRKMYNIIEPSILEQKKITEILSSIENEIQKVDELIKQTSILKKGLMRELFSSENIVLLDTLSKRGSGHTPNKQHQEYWNGDIKWVSLADSNKLDNRYVAQTDKEISLEGIKHSSAVLHPKDTVILCRDAGIGKVGILGSEMAVSQHFISWTCGDSLYYRYLYYWLQSKKEELEQIATGTTIKTIGLSFFKKLSIPTPDLHLQNKIGDFFWTLDEKLNTSKKLKEKLTKLKKGLMSDLLSGKVRTINNQ